MGRLLEAYNEAVESSESIQAVDAAIVENGRVMATAIDDILADPKASATDKTKALYLSPHLVGILRELLATPLARKQMGLAAADQKKAGRLSLIQGQAAKAAAARE